MLTSTHSMALYVSWPSNLKDNPDLVEVCQEHSNDVENACAVADKSTGPASVQLSIVNLLHAPNQGALMKRLQDWEAQQAGPGCNVLLVDELCASGGYNPPLCFSFSES